MRQRFANSGEGGTDFKIKIVIKIGDTKKMCIPAGNVHVFAIPVFKFRPEKSGNPKPKNL
jgi:hypothetical protein